MAVAWKCLIGLGWLGFGILTLGAAEPVALREESRTGQVTRVVAELRADGFVRPDAPTDSKPSKPLALQVEANLEYVERVLKTEPDSAARRSARRVERAGAALNGEILPASSTIRPEVALLVAEARRGEVVLFSPGGPLTRPELDLVAMPADPLALPGLLPGKPVVVGDRWTVNDDAARSLSGYDALASNALEAKLDALDETSAKVRLDGKVRGAVLGGEGTITCSGTFHFDRRAGRIDRLDLTRVEDRKAGPVEAGVDLKSTITLERRAADPPAELSDEALARVSLESRPGLELLLLSPPGGRYTLLHDRDWHTFSETTKRTVLRRLDQGEVIAQCNLAVGPNAGRGRHQDPAQFREDIRRALGPRFVAFAGAGEIEGPPGGGLRYKVDVEGKVGDAGIRWFYYLLASPEGDQLLVTFTLGQTRVKEFADQDLQLIGSLEWKTTPAP